MERRELFLRKYAKYMVTYGLVLPSMVHAVGLGNLKVDSTLNRPLKAYIRLSLKDGTPIDGVKVHLASPEAFQRAGMERPYMLSKLKFSVTRLRGRPIVRISSLDRIDQPFISLLLDVSWAKGQFFRAYTILLDPPGYQLKVKQVNHKKRTLAKQSYAKRASVTKKVLTSYGPTTSSDDLWTIALKYKPQNASMKQTMTAMVKLNPAAFINGNMNQLKRGVRLKIPTASYVKSISKKEAVREVNAHMLAWKNKTPIQHAIKMDGDSDLMQPEKNMEPMPASEPVIEKPQQQTASETVIEKMTDKPIDIAQELPAKQQEVAEEQATEAKIDPPQTSEPKQALSFQKSTEQVASSQQKEPLFDEFIPIPSMLKKIVKQPKASQTALAQKEQQQPDQATTQTKTSTGVNAEVAVAVSAIASVKESNQLLRQQVEMLSKQNTLLQQRIELDAKQDQSTRSKIDLLMKLVDKEYVVNSSGNLIRRDTIGQEAQANTSSFHFNDVLTLFALLLALTSTSGFVYLYLRQKNAAVIKSDEDEQQPLKDEPLEEEQEQTTEVKRYYEPVISAGNIDPIEQQVELEQTVETKDTDPKVKVEQPVELTKAKEFVVEDEQKLEPAEAAETETEHTQAVVIETEDELKDSVKNEQIEEDITADELKPLSEEKSKLDDNQAVANKEINDEEQSTKLEDNTLEFDLSGIDLPTKDELAKEAAVEAEAKAEADPNQLEFESGLAPPLSELKDKQVKEPLTEAKTIVPEIEQSTTADLSSSTEEQDKQQAITKDINMSTQLALAETYIAMEDWESAKVSLAEVIEAGSVEQVEKAKILFKSLPESYQ